MRFVKDSGIVPLRKFETRRRTLSDGNRPKLAGIAPVKLLKLRSSVVRLTKSGENSGRSPMKRLEERLKECRREQRERDFEEREPLMLLLERLRFWRVGIRQKLAGNGPATARLDRSMEMTAPFWGSQVMPVQSQGAF